MKITYTEVNGRRYAYTCTSERVPGKKNPVSRRVYLGIVNPETGEIIPKKGIKETDLVIDRGFRVKSYGDVALYWPSRRALVFQKIWRGRSETAEAGSWQSPWPRPSVPPPPMPSTGP